MILFILTIGLFIKDYLHQEYKNKDHIEENYIYSPNKQSLLKTKFIDEGGLGSSSSIILYKNLDSFFKQEIEFCYNKPNENIKWDNDDEFQLDEILVEIKRINFVLPRPKSGKCIDQLD
ncbi:hypothetical protein EHQ58_18455 [Leptospira ognonensis]|uniref:Uncharacterized protein n=1 Tax=Leptospira ognonensis TaxID=2484945 RepID=A0A4V6QM22_9LEPT|nr:hypothetical protein [Leptospira ognonensis]TGL55691.1 hypothetical protein EHQ58_18455 [Leptospira ognonensis]